MRGHRPDSCEITMPDIATDNDRLMPNPDFTFDQYRALLRRSSEAYSFADFSILGDADLATRKFFLLRHDIDYSPAQALALAKIEAELGVKATYTVQLSGRFYNPLEARTRDQLREIHELGHDIGLHFDAVWHGVETEEALEEAITWEAELLEKIIGRAEIRMFSFHDTTPFTMACQAPEYGGLWNAYAGVLQENVEYTSDSNGFWRFRTWDQLLDESPDRAQVLIHPGWWADEPGAPGQRICQVIDRRARDTWAAYSDNLSRNARENRMGLGAIPEILVARLGPDGANILRLWLSGWRTEACSVLTREVHKATIEAGVGDLSSVDLETFEGLARLLEAGSTEDIKTK